MNATLLRERGKKTDIIKRLTVEGAKINNVMERQTNRERERVGGGIRIK